MLRQVETETECRVSGTPMSETAREREIRHGAGIPSLKRPRLKSDARSLFYLMGYVRWSFAVQLARSTTTQVKGTK